VHYVDGRLEHVVRACDSARVQWVDVDGIYPRDATAIR
jgi:hypothetical protein